MRHHSIRLFDFKISKIDREKLETSGASHVERELKFRGVKGHRADVEASIEKVGKDSYLTIMLSYGENFIQNACGSRKFLESTVIWESDRLGPIPNGTLIAGIFTGDYNHDKKTDLLILLTSGATYLFQQVPGRTPPTTCESKED